MVRVAAEPRNIALVLEYDGTDFQGFQYQVAGRTIQGEVEAAIRRVTGVETRVAGAGRTDAGVHATGQVATFTTTSGLDIERLYGALNAVLPDDVVVKRVVEAPAEFHARFSARSRSYVYRVWNDEAPTAIWRRCSHQWRRRLDVAAMQRAVGAIVGSHDFAGFSGSMGGSLSGRTTVREVIRASWERSGTFVDFEITANAFLPHMVRNLVGTFLLVGGGKLDAGEMANILAARDRRLAGPTAPARGLCLTKVEYAPSGFSIQPATRGASTEGRSRAEGPAMDVRADSADDD
jgi:tRNA pseudouridine38-40 synthase